MSQTSSYDVVVGAVATVMRVDTVPSESAIPGYYPRFDGVLETAATLEPIGGQTVNLVVDGAAVQSTVTSSTGRWEFSFSLEPGTHAVKARFDGTAEYEASETPTYSLTPSKLATVMPVSTTPPSTIDAGAFFDFDGNLREEASLVGIVGRDVELYINGSPTGDRTPTTTDGYWLFPMSFPETGTYSVQAVFPGDAMYLGCHKELSTRSPLLAVAGVLAGLVGIACLRH